MTRTQLVLEFEGDVGTNDLPAASGLGPNPAFGDFCHTLANSRAPKAIDKPYSQAITAGKNTYVYDAHTYHTKVPPQGIEPLIEYYTQPGDVVLDPFCGSGMTGVAATSLARKALLSDLSPAAAFIAYNLNTPIDAGSYLNAVRSLLAECAELERRLYATRCRDCGQLVPSSYTVWSYAVTCNRCHRCFVLWDVARDERPRVRDSKILAEFPCPHCGRQLQKRSLKRTQRHPVMIGYRCCQSGLKEATHVPGTEDLDTLASIERTGVPHELWFPTDPLPDGVNTKQPIAAGITTIDRAYTTRALWAMAHLWKLASDWPDEVVRNKLLFTLTSLYRRVTVFSEFRFWGGSGNTANLNVPAIMNEQNVFQAFARKADTIALYFGSVPPRDRQVRISNQSACHLPQLPDESVDYVFTDPPFGSNINYSEMNFLWESWLRVRTDVTEEAIINAAQRKGPLQYQRLLTAAFSEAHRALKRGAWLTVMFHNSSARVWTVLQRAICDAGFVIEGTQRFDKRHGTFKQFVSDNTVSHDLLIHCRKSHGTLNNALKLDGHKARQSAKAFIRTALQRADGDYRVRYLHVRREDETDYRRLYAEWLAASIAHSFVSIDFDEFRRLVDNALRADRQ